MTGDGKPWILMRYETDPKVGTAPAIQLGPYRWYWQAWLAAKFYALLHPRDIFVFKCRHWQEYAHDRKQTKWV